MDYGTLRVTTPDGQVREYPIETAHVVIGRSDGNGVVIDHVSVSRRHAQLKFESDKLLVEDLGSANGSFLGSQRLPANTPAEVTEGQSLRFGDVEARFIFPNSEAAAPAGAQQSGNPQDTQGTIGVSLVSPSSPVAVGAATTATVVVQNRGTSLDQLTISVIDLPPAWVRISRPNVPLVAGARDEITIVIQPPRSPESTAGEHPFAVSVVSSENGREVRVLGTCTILPFEAFSMSLDQHGSGYQVVVENQGNAPMAYTLAASSDGGQVTTGLGRETVELAPGENASVPLSVAAKGRPLFGAVQVRKFRVQAKPARGSGQAATAEGQVTVRPPLRYWKWPVLALLLLALFGGGAYGYSKGCSSNGWPGCTSKVKADPAGTPTTPPTAAPSGEATPAVLRNGSTALIVNSPPNECLFVREFHTRNAADPRSKQLGQLCDGQKVLITSDSVDAEGFIWWSIDDGAGLKGWAAERPTAGGDPFMILSQ